MTTRIHLISLGLSAAIFTLAIPAIEYMDILGPSQDVQIGRTKNSIATVVAGTIGQKMHGNSRIQLEIEKQMWPDSTLSGHTTSQYIQTEVDLSLGEAIYKAQADERGRMHGEVDKSELNWKVQQTDVNKFDIARWGPKFDSELELNVKDGNITGTYIRNGVHFNWDIEGTYDQQGNVEVEIDGPLNLGITLKGKITKQ